MREVCWNCAKAKTKNERDRMASKTCPYRETIGIFTEKCERWTPCQIQT